MVDGVAGWITAVVLTGERATPKQIRLIYYLERVLVLKKNRLSHLRSLSRGALPPGLLSEFTVILSRIQVIRCSEPQHRLGSGTAARR